MAIQKLLKSRGNRILISLLILLLLVIVYFYIASKEKESALKVLNTLFQPEISDKLFIVIPLALSVIIIPFLINLLTTDVGAKFSEDSNELNLSTSTSNEIIIKSDTYKLEPQELQNNQKFYPNNFIPDLKFFTGRRKLLGIVKEKLETNHRVSIHDISGLGKTFSTYKFANENQEKYEKIFFVRANKEEVSQSLAEIGVLLNSSLENESDQSKQGIAFKDWLEKNKKWLVIYDNVDNPSELKPFIPINKNGDCLFTSNFHSIENLAECVSIEKLDVVDAKALLFSRAKNQPQAKINFSIPEEELAFEKIIEDIDGHPLSLNTTGAFISESMISFAEFERKLQKTPNILLENEDGFDGYQRKSALRAFSIAIDDVCAEKPNDKFKNLAELARKILFAVSFLAQDNIPEHFLKSILRKIIKAESKEINEDLWLEIRRKLLEYDLLKFDGNIFTTHRLIQSVIQTKSSMSEKKAIISSVLKTLDELFPWSGFGNWEICDIYLPHSISIVNFADKVNLSSAKMAKNYYKIGRHFRERGLYSQSVEYIKKAVDEYHKHSREKDLNLSTCLNELAIAYRLQGEYDKAIELFKEVLKRSEKTIDENTSDYANGLKNLAQLYDSQGKGNEALKLYKQALEIDKKITGKNNPEYVTRLNNLANICRIQNKYDEAVKLFEEVLIINEQITGKNHPDYAISLNNLASVYRLQGKFDKAFQLYEQALEIEARTIGKNHPRYKTQLNNLAMIYDSQNRYEEALILYKEMLAINEKAFGRDHFEYAKELSKIAYIYETQGNNTEALKMFEEALKVFNKTSGETHLNTQYVERSVWRCKEKLKRKFIFSDIKKYIEWLFNSFYFV